MSGSSLVVPIVLWGQNAPTHCVSAILMTQDQRNIITGCNDGQIIIWDIVDMAKIYPRCMLFGHTAAITCLARGSCVRDRPFIVSAADNGEMCLWDISDGRCLEYKTLSVTHTYMQSYQMLFSKDIRLICNGYYPEIHVMDPVNLEILFSLASKITSDWISACCILRPVNREDDVVVAISNSGTVKVWTLEGPELRNPPKVFYEDESKQIRCLNAQTLACCAYNQRTVLIVCSKYWQIFGCIAPSAGDPEIYDAGDFSLLCSESARCGERWSGGEFIGIDRVVVWSNEGKGYLFKLPTNANPESQSFRMHVGPNAAESASPQAYGVLDIYMEKPLVCPPAMTYFFGTLEKQRRLLLRGDSEGRIVMWMIPDVSEKQMTLVRQESFDRLPVVQPRCSITLQEAWDALEMPPVGIIDELTPPGEKAIQITATIYIPGQGRLVCGREDGTIVVVPATQSVILHLLKCIQKPKSDLPHFKVLQGHQGKVTALLYPFNESTRYEPNYLVSGGADFSVCLWDLYTGNKLHTFTVHGGEVTELTVPPNGCNARILPCICSIGSDHSVALLSLKERKCITLASRHMFPVQTIKWRPLDDFMVVSCSDGTVYVWQMETGHLDRVVHGILAEEILNACDEMMRNEHHHTVKRETLANPTISIAQAFRRRNLATFKNLAQQKFQNEDLKSQYSPRGSRDNKPQAFPMLIQGVRANVKDPEAHVLFFDTEALIVQLLSEEYATMSPGHLEAHGFLGVSKPEPGSKSPDMGEKFAGFIAKVKDKADIVGQQIQAKAESAGIKPPEPAQRGKLSPRLPITTQPGKKKPKKPKHIYLTEGNLTMEIAQLLMSCLHAWGLDPDLDKLCLNKLGLLRPLVPICFGLLSRGGHMSLLLPGWHKRLCVTPVAGTSVTPDTTIAPPIKTTQTKPPHIGQIAKGVPVNDEVHTFSTKAHWRISSAVTTQHLLSIISIANTVMSMNTASFLVGRSPVSLLRKSFDNSGLMITESYSSSDPESDADGDGGLSVQQAQTKQGWSLLAALHCVLLPDMVGLGNYQCPRLQMLASRWQDRCLEIREAAQALLLAELRRIGPEGRKRVVNEWAPYLPNFKDATVATPTADTASAQSLDVDEEEDDLETESSSQRINDNSYETRRRQATAIVMLGVIGAEFGQEITPSRRASEQKGVLEGFDINHALARQTSNALTYLLLQPASQQLPAFTPIRRAAIDLIGRGFTVWQPYVDVSALLLGLLELCVDGDRLVPSMTFGLPLSPHADACRTSRHSLTLIATARPSAFVTTMAKEVARYNALAQSAQSQNPQLHTSVLIRGKSEILRVIEHLIDKLPNDVAELMVEVMDIVVHCIDHGQVKARGLPDVFPPAAKFCIVSYDMHSRRICVGSKNGGLAFYELKHAKVQSVPAHSKPITAVAFSPDGKFLAAYCHGENRLTFWQTSSGSLFSIGQQHMKCVKTFSTPQHPTTPATNLLKLASLVWTDNRTAILLMSNGSETRYRV